MQERQNARRQAGLTWLPGAASLLLAVSIASVEISYSVIAVLRWQGLASTSATSNTVATNGASRWVGDRQVTASSFDFSPPSMHMMSVSPLFADYYTTHNGTTSLGTPLTVAFPIEQGWLQFFDSGALLLPTVRQSLSTYAPLAALDKTSVKDRSSGIIRLPLLQALLTAGSKAPLGGDGGHLTYVDLRKATNPTLMLPAPATARSAASSPAEKQDIFIKGGTRAGKAVGHLIPRAFWNYVQRPDISPDGWNTDFGPPLTEALPFTITKDGYVHHMLVQAFWRSGLVLDQTALDTSGQPQFHLLETGVAYLSTIGPPAVTIGPQQTIWTQGGTQLLDGPGTGHPVAHIGQDFPLTPLIPTWNAGMLWYDVRWNAPKLTATAWVAAAAVTFSSPGNVPGWASVDALSPSLAAYLLSSGGDVDAVIYDVSRQRYYTYNADAQFIAGSSMKVPIMLTFLDQTEREDRESDAHEMDLLTTMIENSDNDAASALYYGEIGGAAGVARYVQRIGITGLNPDANAWGYSLITPLAMVKLLTHMYEGKVLTAQDDKQALSLMGHIESDQQVGVGDTAPQGASVAMKDGWLSGPDGQWAMNSSGIVTLGQETYIIAVYTQEQDSLGDGQAIVRHVCGTVASLLIT